LLAALALFLQYNSLFLYGFVAYQFGVGLFLIAFALWYRWRESWDLPRLLAVCALSVLVYFGHLAGYVFLGLAAGIVVLADTIRARRIAWRAVAGIAALMAPVAIYVSPGAARGNAAFILWSTIPAKLRHALVLLTGYDLKVDAAVAVLLAVAFLLAWRAGKLRFHPAGAGLAAAFWLLFFVSPAQFLTGTDADTRFVLPAGVFTLLAVTIRIPRRMGTIACSLALAALIMRLGLVAWTWQGQDRLMAANIEFFDNVPRGARIYPIFEFSSDLREGKFERPLYHIVSWATVRRDAIVPTNFAVKGQHPVVERDGFWFKEFQPGITLGSFDWEPVFGKFDIIWFFGTDRKVIERIKPRCELIGTTGKASLYRVIRREPPARSN
jgi:hypothetical protein